MASNAWGGTLYFANANDSLGSPFTEGADATTGTSIPYRLGLRTDTPWGVPIVLFAVQPQ